MTGVVRVDWRPYTEHAPADIPLWLHVRGGTIIPGEWSSSSGFLSEYLGLGQMVTHWVVRSNGSNLTLLTKPKHEVVPSDFGGKK